MNYLKNLFLFSAMIIYIFSPEISQASTITYTYEYDGKNPDLLTHITEKSTQQ